jgi:hypothetical protein
MKNKIRLASKIAVVVFTLLLTLISISEAKALPDQTVKVNGKLFNPDFYFARPDVPYAKPREGNIIVVEIKAMWIDGSLMGSGSLHGINCHSTFFFNDLVGNIEDDTLTLSGTVTSTSTPFEGWIGAPIQLVTDLQGNDMHLIIAGFIDFAGSGIVVL